MNKTLSFLREIEELFTGQIPGPVYERAKSALLDYLAVTTAGAASQHTKLKAYLEKTDPEAGEIAAVALERKFCLKEAVFLNGLNAHALDLDDGVNEGIIHLGSPLFSVLLPLSQKYPVSVANFLKAAIIGYETAFTLASSIQPKHKELGYHATATCGILGISLAVSYLLNFSEEERWNAFATACVSASGVLNVLDGASELKPYNVAKSSLLGLIASQMALAGYEGPPDPLGSERGFLSMMTRCEDVMLKRPCAGGRYAIEKTYTKPYAACRYCHPAIEAAIKLRAGNDFKIEDIASVEVKTYQLAVNKHDHTDVPNSASAKMSIPYGVAIGLIRGRAALNEYSAEQIADPELIGLIRKVRVLSDDEFTRLFPEKTVASLELRMKDGRVLCAKVEYPKGEPENPLDTREFEDRFIDLFAFAGKTENRARGIIDYVNNVSLEQELDYERLS